MSCYGLPGLKGARGLQCNHFRAAKRLPWMFFSTEVRLPLWHLCFRMFSPDSRQLPVTLILKNVHENPATFFRCHMTIRRVSEELPCPQRSRYVPLNHIILGLCVCVCVCVDAFWCIFLGAEVTFRSHMGCELKGQLQSFLTSINFNISGVSKFKSEAPCVGRHPWPNNYGRRMMGANCLGEKLGKWKTKTVKDAKRDRGSCGQQ